MEKESELICAGGLTFFGRTNRFISHELKNILAIISETLGLIEELLELAEKGKKLKPGKLRSLSESVLEEVDRANEIIRNMNIFGHSVDSFLGEVDINRTISLMIGLLWLDPSSRNTEIHFSESNSIMIYHSPFFLGSLIYRLLKYSHINTGPEKTITVSVIPMDSRIRISLSGIIENNRSLLSRETEMLARAISADISFDDSAGEMYLDITSSLEGSFINELIADKT